jgi:hypothetical protein
VLSGGREHAGRRLRISLAILGLHPSGHSGWETLTFLFAGMAGSRALLRRLGEDVYVRALAGHHAVMFMRAASPSSRAWRPRSNWLVRAASVIGGPAGSSAWVLVLSA